MLQLSGLKAGYDNQEILHGIGLRVMPSEIVALIGPNGSGKSTLLKSVFNLCKIFSGRVLFMGNNITQYQTYRLINMGISYVLQGRQNFPKLTIKENLEMGAYALKGDKSARERIKSVLDKFPFLAERQKDYASSLSGGEQQMLSIARALIQHPKLIFLDEPSLGLDPKSAQEVFKTISRINKEGISMLIVEQNIKQVAKISDRIYVLKNGKINSEISKEKFSNSEITNIYFNDSIKPTS